MNNLYHSPKSGLDGFSFEMRSFRKLPFATPPAYQAVLRAVIDTLEESAVVREVLSCAWEQRQFWSLYERPVLLMASLRFDALSVGPAHPLWATLGLGETTQFVTQNAILHTFLCPKGCLTAALAERSVQTNETTRAVAWRMMTQRANNRPMGLIDIGCSAGLNLIADQLPLRWSDHHGVPLRIPKPPPIVARVGFDRNPIDITDPEELRWLTACIRPGEDVRLHRLETATQSFKAMASAHTAPRLVRCDATEAPEFIEEIICQRPDAFWLVYQTGFRDYLPPEKRDRYEAAMHTLMAMRPAATVCWVELETATQGGSDEYPAWIKARRRGADGRIECEIVARCNYHPERVSIGNGIAPNQLAS